METVTDFIFLGSKITADGDCSHENKRYSLHERKSMIKARQNIKKQRYHFADRGPYGHSFSSKEQAYFNFMAAVTMGSDFGAPKNSLSLFPLFAHVFAMK